MSGREELERLVAWGAMIPAHKVMEIVDQLLNEAGPEWVSTDQASQLVGCSADYWQDRARAGEIQGAFQKTEGGPWLLPLEACRAHLVRASNRKLNGRRKPWKKAS